MLKKILTFIIIVLMGTSAFSADIVKTNNTTALNLGASWYGGIVPSTGDVAVWDNNVTGANNPALGADTSWLGVKVTNVGGLVIKAGTGKWSLRGTNTYTGVTIVSNGVLSLTTTNSLPSTTRLYLYSSGTNDLNFTETNIINSLSIDGLLQPPGTYGTNNVTYTNTTFFTGDGILKVEQSVGVWTNLVGGNWSNSGNWEGGTIASGACASAYFTNATGVTITNTYLALTNANFYFTNANYTITGGTNILDCPMTGTSTVTVAGTRTATITTKLHGTNTLVKQGTGTLSLNTANTYSGGTIISAGTLIGNNADSLGGRAITLGNSASGTDTVTLQFANGVTVTNAITVTTNGGLATIGVGTYSGPIVINKDLQTPNPGLSSGDFSSYGGITGTGNLIVAASGGWRTRLGNAGSGGGIANTFTGNVYVASGGVLNMGGGYSVTKNLLPDTAMLSVTGSVEMTVGVVNEVIDTLTGNGTFDVGSGGTLTVGYNNGTGTYTGTLSGLGGLTKIGTGKQTLSGNNISYTGNTVISNGTLIVTTNMAGNSTLYIYSGATLEARDYGLKTNKTINFNYANNVMGAFVVTNNLNLNSNVIIQINGSGTLPSPLVLFTYNTISGVTNNFDSWTIRGVYNMVPVIDTANKRVVLRVDNDGWKIPLEQPKNLQRNKLMKIRR